MEALRVGLRKLLYEIGGTESYNTSNCSEFEFVTNVQSCVDHVTSTSKYPNDFRTTVMSTEPISGIGPLIQPKAIQI